MGFFDRRRGKKDDDSFDEDDDFRDEELEKHNDQENSIQEILKSKLFLLKKEGLFDGDPRRETRLIKLEKYVVQLCELFQKDYDSRGRSIRAQAIGIRIDDKQGFAGKYAIIETVRVLLGGVAYRELEAAWRKAGIWRG